MMEHKPGNNLPGLPTGISIKETEKEYLLFIPPNQKERARGIEGRRWDVKRRCWVYPRNIRMYNALVAEFGDDLTLSSSFTRPQSPGEQERKEREDKEKEELRKEISRVHQTLSELLSSRTDGEHIDVLEKIIQDKDVEIKSLKTEVQKKEWENGDLKRQVAQLEAEKSKFANETETSVVDKEQLIKEIALETTGNDPVFGETIRKLRIDENLPLEICRIIENHLKNVLGSPGTFYDLIVQCKDAQILDEDDVGLLHSIRIQRNIVAHSNVDERTKIGRALFCLFAASLLFPKLPED